MNSGWFMTILQTTSRSGGWGIPTNESFRSPPFGFPDSQNALEDAFGLTAALVSARIFRNSSLMETNGTATVTFMRVGSGNYFALVYAVPPIFCALVLVWFLIGGKVGSSQYESSKLEDLIRLGEDRATIWGLWRTI